MPDLLAHVALGRLASMRLRSEHAVILVLTGAVLPDLASKFFLLLIQAPAHFAIPSHSLLGTSILCYAGSLAFEESTRLFSFFALWVGALLHLGLDLLKKTIIGLPLFFPFHDKELSAGLFLSEDSLYAAPIGLLILGYFFWRRRVR